MSHFVQNLKKNWGTIVAILVVVGIAYVLLSADNGPLARRVTDGR